MVDKNDKSPRGDPSFCVLVDVIEEIILLLLFLQRLLSGRERRGVLERE